jgi:hypothetical protein
MSKPFKTKLSKEQQLTLMKIKNTFFQRNRKWDSWQCQSYYLQDYDKCPQYIKDCFYQVKSCHGSEGLKLLSGWDRAVSETGWQPVFTYYRLKVAKQTN